MFFAEWKPRFALPLDIERVLSTYLGTRARKHTKLTIKAERRKKMFNVMKPPTSAETKQ
jgi:hypothetical protein